MRKFFLIGLISCACMSCQKKDDPLNYYSPLERDSLLTDIVTYIYSPPIRTPQTRFDAKHRKYYVAQISKFKLEKYFVNKEGVHFYYIIRPARSAEGNVRGVGGFFKRDAKGKKIISFKEVFNTPVLKLPELRHRGDEIFQWMVKYGHVNEYLKNPDYVEWPNKYAQYDTVRYEWIPIN